MPPLRDIVPGKPVYNRRSNANARALAQARERSASLAKRRAVQLAARKHSKRVARAVSRPKSRKRIIARIDPETRFGYSLSKAAVERTRHQNSVRYDGKYVKIGYPWGDVPKSIGVCTDVVIRAYRRLGIDLQQEVHKDITNDFYAYPNLRKWGLRAPDPNIDHRRVYNLQAFFKRHKAELPRSRNPRDYKPGDLVTWMVGPQFPHIGVVVNIPSKSDPSRLMIAHNIGRGPEIEDILFKFPMTGHYRYTAKNRRINPTQWIAKTPPPQSVLLAQQQDKDIYSQLLIASKALATPPKNVVNKRANNTVSLAAVNKALLGVDGISEDDILSLLR